MKFYTLHPNDDGSVDVYLKPDVRRYETPLGVTEYDVTVPVIRGLAPWPGMEDDIRAHYDTWRASAEVIEL